MIRLYSCRIVLFGKSFAQAKSHGNRILVASRQMLDIRIMTGDDGNKLLQCYINTTASKFRQRFWTYSPGGAPIRDQCVMELRAV